ncbi:MAG: type IV pili twitching motility protein PilT, partial [candidate division WOR-3 bacterium]
MDLKPILKKMIDSDASDLHLKVGTPPILRINGELVPMEMNKLGKEEVRIAASSLMTKKQQEAFLKGKEADFGIGIPGISRFRVNIYIQRGSIALAIRPISREIKSIEELQLPIVLNDLAFATRGLVL